MLSNLLVVASQVVTLFLLMGIGFALAQWGKLHTDGVSQMSFLVLYIVTPCLIISSFETERTPELTVQLSQFFLAYGAFFILNILIARRCFPKQNAMRQGPMRFALVYGNNSFMGLPLLLSILGPQAVIFGVVSAVIFNLFMWSHGVHTMGGKITLRQLLISPATVGFAVGLPLFLLGWRLPATLNTAVGFVADLNTPLAMIVIGAQMAGADLKVSFTSLKLYATAAFRLILSPLIVLVALLPFRLDPTLYCACVIMSAVPVAGATGMFAQRFEKDTAVAAQLVTLSTLLSVLTLPVFAVAAQRLSGF